MISFLLETELWHVYECLHNNSSRQTVTTHDSSLGWDTTQQKARFCEFWWNSCVCMIVATIFASGNKSIGPVLIANKRAYDGVIVEVRSSWFVWWKHDKINSTTSLETAEGICIYIMSRLDLDKFLNPRIRFVTNKRRYPWGLGMDRSLY